MARSKLPKSPTQMKSLNQFRAGELPPAAVKKLTMEVNDLIAQYNATVDKVQKNQTLKDIQKKITGFNHQFSDKRHFVYSPDYHQAQRSLFEQIQGQQAILEADSSTSKSKINPSLPRIMANMSPHKVDKLMFLLMQQKVVLRDLYADEGASEEATAWMTFLSNHQFERLNAAGNSINFKVTRVLGKPANEEFILKAEDRMGVPKRAEDHLRGRLGNCFTSTEVERPALYTPTEEEKTSLRKTPTQASLYRTLMVTEYCPGGSVNRKVASANIDPNELLEDTGNIFLQMAGTLLDIQEAGCVFPDAKSSNWLLDKEDKIRIADTKSLLFVNHKGEYDVNLPENQYTTLLRTLGYYPPEFANLSFKADPVHAYILGINLYEYITTNNPTDPDSKIDFDFNLPIFRTEKGKEYSTLIQGLIKPDPDKRFSVRDAQDQLFIINNPEFKQVLTDLRALEFGKNDTQINAFIRTKHQEIDKATPEKRKEILLELQATVLALQDPALKQIKDTIEGFKKRAGAFTVGMNAKAERIERAMADLPIEERMQFLSSKKTDKVMKALASHRHWGKRGETYLTAEGKIDNKHAAQSFKDFKTLFTEKVTDKKTPDTVDTDGESRGLKH